MLACTEKVSPQKQREEKAEMKRVERDIEPRRGVGGSLRPTGEGGRARSFAEELPKQTPTPLPASLLNACD